MKKNYFFVFSILKILGFMLFEVNFLKSVGKNSKNYFTRAYNSYGIITEIVKKFGVHSCIFQGTAGDQYQGGLK